MNVDSASQSHAPLLPQPLQLYSSQSLLTQEIDDDIFGIDPNWLLWKRLAPKSYTDFPCTVWHCCTCELSSHQHTAPASPFAQIGHNYWTPRSGIQKLLHKIDSQVAAQLLVGRAFSDKGDISKWANSVPSLSNEAYAMAYHFLTLASQNLMPPLAIVDMLATFFRALGDR